MQALEPAERPGWGLYRLQVGDVEDAGEEGGHVLGARPLCAQQLDLLPPELSCTLHSRQLHSLPLLLTHAMPYHRCCMQATFSARAQVH